MKRLGSDAGFVPFTNWTITVSSLNAKLTDALEISDRLILVSDIFKIVPRYAVARDGSDITVLIN